MNFEEIIEKIEDILEEGKPSFGGGGKVKVDADAIHEHLKELSSSIPAEIIQARKIVADRREVLHSPCGVPVTVDIDMVNAIRNSHITYRKSS